MTGEADHHRRELERLHQGMVVELDRRFPGRGERQVRAARDREEPSVDEEVASTISVIRQVATVLGDLQETIRRQEELLYEQRQIITDLQHQKQAAYAEQAEAERVAKAERDRAERAEHRAQNGEAQIRRLEEYSVSLKSHLNSLMAVVRDSLSVGEPVSPARLSENRSA